MKKRTPIIVATLLGSLLLAGCNAKPDEPNKPGTPDQGEVVKSYLVSFYVDGNLYKTAKVNENEVVGEIIVNPKKTNYDFKGWKTESGDAFDLLTTKVTCNTRVDAIFELIKADTGKDDENKNLNVLDVKDPTKTYSLVIGWYGKSVTSGCTEENMKHFYSNAISFLKAKKISEDKIAQISFRKYGDSETAVAPLGELINKDADVDILLGVGKNITSTGKVETKERCDTVKIGEKTRSIARLTDNEIAISLYNHLKTEKGLKMLLDDYTFKAEDIEAEKPIEPDVPVTPDTPKDDIDETKLNVLDTKDESKTYSLVFGWYGKSSTSGCTEENMKHFYANSIRYLKGAGINEDKINQISFRKYGDDSTKVGPLGELVNKDGDVDIMLGCGANITTIGKIETTDLISGVKIGEATGRVLAKLSTNEIATTLFDYLKTEDGIKLLDASYTYKK